MRVRNAKYETETIIDVEIEHPQHGWIPYTFSAQAEIVDDIQKEVAKYLATTEITPIVMPTNTELVEQAKVQIENAIQNMLDNEAKSRGYDNINSIAKYLRPSSQFYNEAILLLDWCDACWTKAYEIQATATTIPTGDEVLAQMPKVGA